METVWVIIIATVAITAPVGILRAGARSWAPLALQLALLLASAGICYLISGTKTGGYLPGIGSVLLCLLMLIAAGGVATGAAGRWLWDQFRPIPLQPTVQQPTRTASWAANWDLWLIGALSAVAVLLSAME